ncbi:isoprenoid synthase domain-containing protein [Lentinula edodes]|nr:isoprenoid synthase domain-containing protein [Lentinula edodes]
MHLQLPETLDHWPWMRILNVHYDQVKHDSQLWLEGFQPFSPEAQNAFEKCEFALLASLAYPYFSKTQLRAGADLMNVFFVFDEYTDVENEIVVAQLGIEIMDGLRNPHKFCNIKGGSILRKMAAEFWANTMSIATPSCQAHFLHACHEYVLSVVEQARDRSGNKVHSIQDYLEVRRLAAGVYPSLALLELDLDLSDHVIHLQNLDIQLRSESRSQQIPVLKALKAVCSECFHCWEVLSTAFGPLAENTGFTDVSL